MFETIWVIFLIIFSVLSYIFYMIETRPSAKNMNLIWVVLLFGMLHFAIMKQKIENLEAKIDSIIEVQNAK